MTEENDGGEVVDDEDDEENVAVEKKEAGAKENFGPVYIDMVVDCIYVGRVPVSNKLIVCGVSITGPRTCFSKYP